MSEEFNLQDVLSDPALREEALKELADYDRRRSQAFTLDEELLEQIPAGFYGRKVIGDKSYKRALKLGYKVAQWLDGPKKGDDIELDEFQGGYLMLLPEKDKQMYELSRYIEGAKARQTKSVDRVNQTYDSSGNPVFRDLKE